MVEHQAGGFALGTLDGAAIAVKKLVLAFASLCSAAGVVGKGSRCASHRVLSNVELVGILKTTLISAGYPRNPTEHQNEKTRQKAGFRGFQRF